MCEPQSQQPRAGQHLACLQLVITHAQCTVELCTILVVAPSRGQPAHPLPKQMPLQLHQLSSTPARHRVVTRLPLKAQTIGTVGNRILGTRGTEKVCGF